MQLKPQTNPEAQWIKWWKSWQCQRRLFRDLGWLRLPQYLLQMKALAIMCIVSQCLLCCSGSQTEPRIPGLKQGSDKRRRNTPQRGIGVTMFFFFFYEIKSIKKCWKIKWLAHKMISDCSRSKLTSILYSSCHFVPLKMGPWCYRFGKPCLTAPLFSFFSFS